MENKRIYSINLGAYIMEQTELVPQFIEDEKDKGIYYLIFPQCAAVKECVKQFKQGNPTIDLHAFLHSIKQIRETMAALRGEK